MLLSRTIISSALLVARVAAANFTISNGQIFTPGFVVLDAPQPNTPLGGDTLQVAIDVSANGKLPLPPFAGDSQSQIFNITMFLSSYITGRNLTISNGTADKDGASVGEIMAQEDGSTVKHVNWVWPDCLVGDGKPDNDDSDRGTYNISIRQNFRLNGDNRYTVFDVPISVTNSIEANEDRPSCGVLANKMLSPEEIDAGADDIGVLFAPGDATKVDSDDDDGNGDDDGDDDGDKDGNDKDGGLGDQRPEAQPDDGLGDGAAGLGIDWRLYLLPMASTLIAVALI